MTNLRDAALEYRELGFSVIPIKPRSKKPLVKWKRFTTEHPSPDQIKEWWDTWPDANIAIITGRVSGVVVVDVDPDRGGDYQKIIDQYPTGVVAQTGSGGHHLFYQCLDSDIPNSVGEDGIDIRGEGGYVIASPSIHPSGNAYEWLENDNWDIAPYPSFIRNGSNTPSVGSASGAWLEEIAWGVGKGQRNEAAARLTGYLANHHSKNVVEILVMQWNQFNEPPLEEAEIKRTVASIFQTKERKAERTLSLARIVDDTTIEEQIDAADWSVEDPFAITPLSDYMVQFGEHQVDWMVEGWMPQNTIAMMVAPPGSYKTWLELDLAVSVAGGVPFLGEFPIEQQGPVLVIQQEDFHGQMAERIGLIVKTRYGLHLPSKPSFRFSPPPQLPIYLHPDRRFRFDNEDALRGFEDVIERIKPVLVIIDPLYSTARLDDYLSSAIENMFTLKRLRDEHDVSFLLSHHTRKSTEGGTDRQDAWGTQFLNAFIETGWQIRRRDAPNTALIRRHFKVKEDTEEEILTFDISTEAPYRYVPTIKPTTSTGEEAATSIVELLDTGGPMKAQTLTRKTGLNRSTVSRRLRKLVEAKVLTKEGEFYRVLN